MRRDTADGRLEIVTIPRNEPVGGYVNEFVSVMPTASWDMHQDFEIGVQLTGARESYIEDREVKMSAGDVWLHPPWEPHGWRVTVPGGRDLAVLFLPDFLGDAELDGRPWFSLFALPPDRRPLVNSPPTRREVLSIADELCREFIQQRPGWIAAARLNTLRLLLTLQRGEDMTGAPGRFAGVERSDLSRVMPAVALIRERPGERIPLSEAASACTMSVTQFRCVFRRTMAMTFGKFAVRARLGHAARLLVKTDLTVDAVAHEAAFSDGSHLNAHFRKAYGCTASEYRWRINDRSQSA